MAAARKPKRRRSPGEGGAYPYQTTAGIRYRVKGQVRQVDGTVKEINLRKGPNGEQGTTEKDALAWLHDQQAAGRKGEYVDPSKRLLGAYGAEVIDGLRISPGTKASYRRTWRLHLEPYPVAGQKFAQVTGLALTGHYRVLEKSGRKDRDAGGALSARTVRYLHTIVHRVLAQPVKDGLLLRNAAEAATPPRPGRPRRPRCTRGTPLSLPRSSGGPSAARSTTRCGPPSR
jgi:hypothetical protein